jgi:hypothetical protein
MKNVERCSDGQEFIIVLNVLWLGNGVAEIFR